MVTNDSKINNARVMTMFMAIRNFELKNVRTLQYDSKDMPEVASSICMRCWLCALEPLMMNMVTSGSITFLHC